jgi:hypothetical protein
MADFRALTIAPVKPTDGMDRVTRSLNQVLAIVNSLIYNDQITRTSQDVFILGGGSGPALPVGSGGTGRSSLTAHGLLVGEGTSPVASVSVGATGTALQGSSGADPAFTPTLALGQNSASLAGALILSTGSGTGQATVKTLHSSGGYNFNLPDTAGNASELLTSGGGKGNPMTWTAAQSLDIEVAVGTTVIDSGTSGRVLYDNAGILGEYVITGTGNAVLSASPTLTGTTAADIVAANTFNPTSAQTTVNGSISGTAVFSQPMQGSSLKRVLAYLNALNGTASYTFPTAFTNQPSVIATNDVVATVVTARSTTAVTLTGATTTGFLELVGY